MQTRKARQLVSWRPGMAQIFGCCLDRTWIKYLTSDVSQGNWLRYLLSVGFHICDDICNSHSYA